jgi:dihydrodipicolinate synthase/N-acetylneuraminate lyase
VAELRGAFAASVTPLRDGGAALDEDAIGPVVDFLVSGGVDVFVGPETLIHRGLERGAVGAVSGLAAAFPEAVARLAKEPSADGAAEVGRVREAVQRFPFHAALKTVLGLRGVTVNEDVRAPLRTLDPDERRELGALVQQLEAVA